MSEAKLSSLLNQLEKDYGTVNLLKESPEIDEFQQGMQLILSRGWDPKKSRGCHHDLSQRVR